MYSETDLEAAVAAGAISPESAENLRRYVAAARATPAVDEEHFRLLTGFNDIFVAIAAIILLVAVGWIGNEIPPHMPFDGPSPFSGLAVAATAWGLAEFFTRKRRMALPSIILLLAFVGGIVAATGTTLVIAIGIDTANNATMGGLIGVGAALTGVAAAWLHWRRFRVPITIAAGAASAVLLLISLAGWVLGETASRSDLLLALALLLGIGVFLFAMGWDSSDPRRETRRSDVAFWLHLLAAPLIVHPVFTLLGLTDGTAGAGEAVVVLLVYVALGVTALAIDRRALLVSALAYVLYALSDLFERFGAIELSFAFTALVIGSALLLLSAFWHTARRRVVAPLPAGLRSKLPVLERGLSPQPAS